MVDGGEGDGGDSEVDGGIVFSMTVTDLDSMVDGGEGDGHGDNNGSEAPLLGGHRVGDKADDLYKSVIHQENKLVDNFQWPPRFSKVLFHAAAVGGDNSGGAVDELSYDDSRKFGLIRALGSQETDFFTGAEIDAMLLSSNKNAATETADADEDARVTKLKAVAKEWNAASSSGNKKSVDVLMVELLLACMNSDLRPDPYTDLPDAQSFLRRCRSGEAKSALQRQPLKTVWT